MKGKRLLSICMAVCLLLSATARAVESPAPEDPVISEEETSVPEESPNTEVPAIDVEPSDEEAPPEENPSDVEEPSDAVEPSDTEVPADAEEPSDAEAPADVEEPADVAEPSDTESPAEEKEPTEESAEPETLYVMLPVSARVVVNPYGLEVNMDGITSTDQVVSAPMPIVNYSSVPVAVLASVTGYTAPGSDVVFTTAPPQPDAWAKELFLYAEFQPAYDEYGSGAYWSGQYTGAYNQLTVTPEGAPAAQVMELAAGDEGPSCGAFRLFGSAAVWPDNPWSAEDAIQVTVAFTFVPLADSWP